MSYCRWSSDNYKSDFYVYEDVSGGWTIHMAARRVVGDVPPLEWPKDPTDKAQQDAFMRSYRAQSEFFDTATREDIGLPHDGESYGFATAGECADKCEELAALGYHLPAGVVEALRQEDADPHHLEKEERG